MLNFETLAAPEVEVEQIEPEPLPQIQVVEVDNRYGKFTGEPLKQGYGVTLGNSLRRVLYGSLNGTAITWVKIEGIQHEYSTIPHVKEEVTEILLNIKGIRLRSEVERSGKLRLEVAGQGEVCAGDIMASSDFEVVNPDLHIATMDSDSAKLSMEFNVEQGTGYVQASRGEGLPIGVLPVDAVYTPIIKVNYGIKDIRVGQRTDMERLDLEIWTDGSLGPVDALRQAGNILVEHFFRFANTQTIDEGTDKSSQVALKMTPEQYNMLVEQLDLSSRTLNCLKRASINRVGAVLEMKRSDLLKIRNFGEKSLTELYERLREMDLLPPEFDPDIDPSGLQESEEKDTEQASSVMPSISDHEGGIG